ncbi:MAG: arylsulfatase [Candidatus Hydrogenedentota bacterium]
MNPLNRREFLGATAAAVMGASCATPGGTRHGSGKRPNIVLVLADDMGVGDVQSLYPQGLIPTPHLDRLVRGGMHFTDAHSGSAVCTPTRYGLLTGRYAWRTVLQEWVVTAYEPPLIAPDRLTLPGMLRQLGYATACIGKWHLGWNWAGDGVGPEMKPDFTQPILNGPTTRGFDYYFGTDVPNLPPFTFIENDRVVTQPTAEYTHDPTLHMGWKGGPMAPGWRFDRILPTLTERCVAYVHEHAEKNQPFFLYFPMTTPHEPIAPSDSFKGKSGIAPVADLVMETDWSVGQVMKAVDDAGIADDTIFVFTTDNGHSHYTGWEKLLEAGHRASGPYRGHKARIYEGGHRVPFIVRWPGTVTPDSQSRQLVCLGDFIATFADYFKFPLPAHSAEDSFSFLPVLRDESTTSARDAIVHHDVRGRFAIRHGPWKLVINSGRDVDPVLELYNLDWDVAESQDLSGVNPAIVKRLSGLLESYVANGRSTPGVPQLNDTLEIDLYHFPKQRWATPRPTS